MYSSNHPAQAASYFAPIIAWLPNAREEAAAFAAHLNLTRAACTKALHFSCHLAPWGYQSMDTTIYMHWNGAFASMLFLNHFEYTRNATFARQTIWPLVDGLVRWWSCFLQRSKGSDGSLLLNDWNPIDPDESGENQEVHNPMIGLAFAKRLATFQVMLSSVLFPDQAAPPESLEIARHLAPFPLAPGSPAGQSVWANYVGANSSGIFSLYPIFPTELLSLASDVATLDTARRSVKQYTGPSTTDIAHSRPVEAFPAAVRAGHSGSVGWQPHEVLEGLEKMLVTLQCCDSQMLPVAVGGGVENVGVTHAVNEMLVAAPEGLFIELFPFWPPGKQFEFPGGGGGRSLQYGPSVEKMFWCHCDVRD